MSTTNKKIQKISKMKCLEISQKLAELKLEIVVDGLHGQYGNAQIDEYKKSIDQLTNLLKDQVDAIDTKKENV